MRAVMLILWTAVVSVIGFIAGIIWLLDEFDEFE